MNITVSAVQDKRGKVAAHATVTQKTDSPKGVSVRPKGGVMVIFKVDDKSTGGAVQTDLGGRASVELALKPGEHIVEAHVVGLAGISDTDYITVEAVVRSVGPFGALMMVVFWFFVWLWGPSEWLTVIYLTLAIGTLALVSRIQEKPFGAIILNNNWVAKAALGMLAVTAIMAKANPYKGGSLLRGWMAKTPIIGGALQAPTHPLANEGFWGTINNWFFGTSPTWGWTVASGFYLLAFAVSLAISFSDEIRDLWASRRGGQGGHSSEKKGVAKTLWDELWSSTVIRVLFGIKK